MLAPAGAAFVQLPVLDPGLRPRALARDPQSSPSRSLARVRRDPQRAAAFRGFRLTAAELERGLARRRPPRRRARHAARTRRTAGRRRLPAAGARVNASRSSSTCRCSPRRPCSSGAARSARSTPSSSASRCTTPSWPRSSTPACTAPRSTAIQAWKEVLLAVALARVAFDARRERRLPVPARRSSTLLALAFALDRARSTRSSRRTCSAARPAARRSRSASATRCSRSARTCSAARSSLDAEDLRGSAWTVLGAAAAVAAIGLVEEYAVGVECWVRWDVARATSTTSSASTTRARAGCRRTSPSTPTTGIFRRLISTFLSPLASAFAVRRRAPARRGDRDPAPPRRRRARGDHGRRPPVHDLALDAARARRRPLRARARAAPALAARRRGRRRSSPASPSRSRSTRRAAHALPPGRAGPAGQDRAREGRPPVRRDLAERAVDQEPPDEPARRDRDRRPPPAGLRARQRGRDRAADRRVPKAGESNYTELGVEIGARRPRRVRRVEPRAARRLLRAAWTGEGARAGRRGDGGGARDVLALGVQTDALGVPWLAYCVWWLGGALAAPRATVPAASAFRRAPWSSATEKGLTR